MSALDGAVSILTSISYLVSLRRNVAVELLAYSWSRRLQLWLRRSPRLGRAPCPDPKTQRWPGDSRRIGSYGLRARLAAQSG
jgi:hypothetical protein